MTWVRLDDSFRDHPKVIAAGPLAAWLHVCGLTYASQYLTDGLIPARQVSRLADLPNGEELAEKLVEVGLWERDGEDFQIHDYLAYNPSAEQVKRERQAAADRMRRVRSPEVRPNVRPNISRSSPEVRPTHPTYIPAHVHPGNLTSPESDSVSPVGESPNGAGGVGDSAATSAAPPTIRAVPKSRKTTGTDLGPLIEAFAALGLPRPHLADPAEQHAAGVLLKAHPPPDLAKCWQDFAAGDYGDAYDQRHLSFLHLSKLERVANWRRWKDGEHGQSPGARTNGRGAQSRPAGSPSPFAKYGRT